MHDRDADIDERLRALVRGQLPAPRVIDPHASLRDLGLDSTCLLNLVVQLEEEFAIEIGDDDITVANFDTLQAIGGFVAGRLAG